MGRSSPNNIVFHSGDSLPFRGHLISSIELPVNTSLPSNDAINGSPSISLAIQHGSYNLLKSF